MNAEEYQASHDLMVDEFNLRVRYEQNIRGQYRPRGGYIRPTRIGNVIGLAFFVVIAVWLISAVMQLV